MTEFRFGIRSYVLNNHERVHYLKEYYNTHCKEYRITEENAIELMNDIAKEFGYYIHKKDHACMTTEFNIGEPKEITKCKDGTFTLTTDKKDFSIPEHFANESLNTKIDNIHETLKDRISNIVADLRRYVIDKDQELWDEFYNVRMLLESHKESIDEDHLLFKHSGQVGDLLKEIGKLNKKRVAGDQHCLKEIDNLKHEKDILLGRVEKLERALTEPRPINGTITLTGTEEFKNTLSSIQAALATTDKRLKSLEEERVTKSGILSSIGIDPNFSAPFTPIVTSVKAPDYSLIPRIVALETDFKTMFDRVKTFETNYTKTLQNYDQNFADMSSVINKQSDDIQDLQVQVKGITNPARDQFVKKYKDQEKVEYELSQHKKRIDEISNSFATFNDEFKDWAEETEEKIASLDNDVMDIKLNGRPIEDLDSDE